MANRLFNHLIGELLKMQRHVEAKRLGGFEVDHQLVFGRCLHRKFTWVRSAQNAINERGTKPSPRRAKAVRSALKREGRSAASRKSLATQARSSARRRGPAARHRAAVKAARTRARRSH